MRKIFSDLENSFKRKEEIIYPISSLKIENILSKAISGYEISKEEAIALFKSKGDDILKIFSVADDLRSKSVGSKVTFVVNRNINFTNICYMGCKFCGFAKRFSQSGAELLSLENIVTRSIKAWDRGATEVCIQGGLHPKISGDIYRNIIKSIKKVLPDMHIHAFSPFEVWYGSSKKKLDYKTFLNDLKDCGLGSMPGTAAEILDVEIRNKLTKNKLSSEQWIEIIKTAHSLKIPTSATIMYGHIDNPEHWAMHLSIIRDIQKETGGFTELVPLSFVYKDSPLYLENPKYVRKGPSTEEIKKMHAISRIMLNGWINNIQASWTKLGPEFAQKLLKIGVNDLGGTLMNESISRSAGSNFGQEITAMEMVKIIRNADKIPARRSTIYKICETYESHDPKNLAPLVARKGNDPLKFIN